MFDDVILKPKWGQISFYAGLKDQINIMRNNFPWNTADSKRISQFCYSRFICKAYTYGYSQGKSTLKLNSGAYEKYKYGRLDGWYIKLTLFNMF